MCLRRKFSKTWHRVISTEEIVWRLALTHFDIRFVLVHNQSIKLNLPIADSGELRFQQSVQQLLGRAFTENALLDDADSINMPTGWLGHPSDAGSGRLAVCFMNIEIVKDPNHPHALRMYLMVFCMDISMRVIYFSEVDLKY